MSYTFELNNAHREEATIRDTQKFAKFSEICSALFKGENISKYGKQVDDVVKKLKTIGSNAAAGDTQARAELNSIVKFIIQPRLLESMKVLGYIGNYHTLRYDELPVVKSYTYKNLNAQVQAANSDVNFGSREIVKYPVATQTISSGMVIDYRELETGNFDGTLAEEIGQIQVDMNNKAVALVLDIIRNSLKESYGAVKFYAEYSGDAPTQKAVDDIVTKMRRMGKVSISGDYAMLAEISKWVGYRTIGNTTVPFYTSAQVDQIATSGIIGDYNGSKLVELPNPYNFTEVVTGADNVPIFDTYYDPQTLLFTTTGSISPINIFRRGGITSMSGNDVETGTVKTRYDLEIGADVVKGREFEIGMLAKAK